MAGGIDTIGQRLRPHGGSKTVTTSGTAVPLVAASTPVYMLYVRAKNANTGAIYFGDSAVDKTTSQQVILSAGDSVTITPPHGNRVDLVDFYIDAAINLEGVDLLYIS